MKQDTIAVLDVGKTNKKVLIYDLQFNVLETRTQSFPEIEKDGLQHEQPQAVFNWLCDNLASLSDNYAIKAISVTTHGATIVCVDDEGNVSAPPLSYTNTTEPGFADEFFRIFCRDLVSNFSEWSFYKSVFVDFCVCCEVYY